MTTCALLLCWHNNNNNNNNYGKRKFVFRKCPISTVASRGGEVHCDGI